MKRLMLSVLAVAGLSALVVAAQGKRTFTGVITDSECPKGDHSAMQMGPTDAECTIACVEDHGALFILFDGKDTAYNLSDQKTPRNFAGKKVVVTGTLDTKTNTIKVEGIAAAK
jgi:Protein of unknown function (DUF5818)